MNLVPTDIPPPGTPHAPTPPFHELQTYFLQNALDIDFAHSLGLHGQGMAYADVEYCWLPGHEDLMLNNPPIPEDGILPYPTNPPDYCWHGAAVIGMLSADPYNGFGTKGMVPWAIPRLYTEKSSTGELRRPAAILKAISDTNVGDVIMLEMQARWSFPPSPDTGIQFGPAEFDPDVWNASRTAFDAGRVVVAAAGNGGRNLDAPKYQSYRLRGDSGAIIVGAGNPATREKGGTGIYGTTFGGRVNLQGWDSEVASHGYGYLFLGYNDYNRSYTDIFNGTSSATPMVTAAVLLTQQAVKANSWAPLDAMEMRELLRATGKAQGPILLSEHIGPLPDMQGSLSHLNVADIGITATSKKGRILSLEIANNGPSRAIGRTMAVTLTTASSNAIIQRIDTTGITCQPDPSQYCLSGTCQFFQCQLPDIRFEREVALEWECEGASDYPRFSLTAMLSSGSQTDPVPGNDIVSHQGTCAP